ncbi:hypothetical protein HMPREF3038_00855 [Akkermansia sp. KLE1797]|nr:hypothetical protein HMPREF3038_00855 [Akkermansia sp. KLE1797]KZA04884.1 hypothetical protein HMPREF1326_01465 [Akkermansia sp. KLE1605]
MIFSRNEGTFPLKCYQLFPLIRQKKNASGQVDTSRISLFPMGGNGIFHHFTTKKEPS